MTLDEINDDDFFRDAVHRAILTHDVMPDKERKWVYARLTSSPEISDRWRYADEVQKRPKYRPKPGEVDLCWRMLEWISLAGEFKHWTLLKARAYEKSFFQYSLNEGRGRTPEHWRRKYNDAISNIQDAAKLSLVRAI